MDILFNPFTILAVGLIGLLVAFSTYSIRAIHRHGVINHLSQLGRAGKAIAGVLIKLIGGLIAFFAASAETPDEIQEEQNDKPMQDVGLIGEYNFRTHKLDAGTDPNGWYEEDM